MADRNNADFLREQQRAVERMREMSRRSVPQSPHKMPSAPPYIERRGPSQKQHSVPGPQSVPQNGQQSKDNKPQPNRQQNLLSGLLPNKFSFDADTALLVGLILLLAQENSDKLLLYALIYILV